VIDLLQNILVNFQRAVTKDLDWKRSDIECFLSPFGSYALGGYIRDADIDLVLVCPIQVLRKYFFKFFPQLLKQQTLVSNVEVQQ
jgi:poly(A) polymerase